MRLLVLSDIHSNLEALRAVLAHAARKRRDAVLFLGDAVGYGASPNQVIERLRAFKTPLFCVRGNHDRVALDPSQGAFFFNTNARHAAAWTAEVLTTANRHFLERFEEGPKKIDNEVAICHGSPVDEDEYLFTESDAAAAMERLPARVTFFGHSHVPCMFEKSSDNSGCVGVLLRGSRLVMDLDPGRSYLINPGSVGQPRDRDPRASYALYDSATGRLTLYRVPYDIDGARKRIVAAGLPPVLGDRLYHGT